jgi:hypothetical protein
MFVIFVEFIISVRGGPAPPKSLATPLEQIAP